jgi:glucuronate isomerase
MYAEDYTQTEVVGIFAKIRSGGDLSLEERKKFKSAMLVTLAEWDWRKRICTAISSWSFKK